MAVEILAGDQNFADATSPYSITVPADCDYVVVSINWYNGGASSDSGLQINDVDMTDIADSATTSYNRCGVWGLANPATGAQNLDWVISAKSEGPAFHVVYLKNVDPDTSVRDTATGTDDKGGITLNVDSADGDMCLLFNSSSENCVMAPAGSLQTELTTTVQDALWAEVGYQAGEADGSTALNYTLAGYGYAGSVALTLIAAAAGGATASVSETLNFAEALD